MFASPISESDWAIGVNGESDWDIIGANGILKVRGRGAAVTELRTDLASPLNHRRGRRRGRRRGGRDGGSTCVREPETTKRVSERCDQSRSMTPLDAPPLTPLSERKQPRLNLDILLPLT